MENTRQQFQFKTNINCSGCKATVKPYLDKAEGICTWEVDTNNPNKILTVDAEGITKEQIMETVRAAGFRIESFNP